MQTTKILPPADPLQGFWALCTQRGWQVSRLWATTSAFLSTRFNLTAAEARDLLDMEFGVCVAEDMAFVPGGPNSMSEVERHLAERLGNEGWDKWVRKALTESRRAAA